MSKKMGSAISQRGKSVAVVIPETVLVIHDLQQQINLRLIHLTRKICHHFQAPLMLNNQASPSQL